MKSPHMKPLLRCIRFPLFLILLLSLPEWKMPHMSPVEVEVWREMLNYPYQVDDDVRRMLQLALRD